MEIKDLLAKAKEKKSMTAANLFTCLIVMAAGAVLGGIFLRSNISLPVFHSKDNNDIATTIIVMIVTAAIMISPYVRNTWVKEAMVEYLEGLQEDSEKEIVAISKEFFLEVAKESAEVSGYFLQKIKKSVEKLNLIGASIEELEKKKKV
ncbi:MAG: hypothetical protein JWL92_634 [Candidatus Nomurabacteria bacterium]|nr:hypothetical protein [Candidatus Nomurabacteria bacterium]